MYLKQIYLNKIFTKKNILIIFSAICLCFILSIIHSNKVFAACPTNGNPGNFLQHYDATNFGQNNCGDSLHLSISGADSFDAAANTYSVTQGNTFHVSLGYSSSNGSGGKNVYTWIQMFDPTNSIANGPTGFNINSGSGGEFNYCYSMALPNGPYENASNWPVANAGGKIGCNGETICINYIPPGVTCPSSTGQIFPDPPGGIYTNGNGHSVVYYHPAAGADGTHNYQIDMTTQNSGRLCFRMHISLSDIIYSSGASGSDANYANFLAGNALAPNVVGMYDGQPGSAGNLCIQINPVSSHTQASCSAVSVVDPSPEYQELIHVQEWSFGAGTDIDSPGTVQIPSGGSFPPTDDSSRVTSGYQGDGPQSANIAGEKRNSYDWNGTQLFVVNHGDVKPPQWQYITKYEYVEVTFIQRHHDPVTKVWTTTAYSDTLYTCAGGKNHPGPGTYFSQVTCSLSVTGDGPGGEVTEDGVNGGTVHVRAIITNGGDIDLPQNDAGYILQFNRGNYNSTDLGDFGDFSQYGPPGDGPIYAHSSREVDFDTTVSPTLQPRTYRLVGHPAYSGDYQFGPGSDCATTVNVYAPFTLTPSGQPPNLSPSPEAPTDVINSTWVTETGATVNEHVTGYVSKITAKCGASTVNSKAIDGPYSNGNTYNVYNKFSYKACTPTTVGDNYCDETNVPAWSGYVDVNNNIINTGGSKEYLKCTQVENRPTFKVYGGGVEAGGAFSDGSGASCTSSNTGTLAGWNNNTGVYPPLNDFGSGTSLNSLASGTISGFASSQLPPSNTAYGNTASGFTTTPYYQSFANLPPTPPWNVSQTTDIATPDIGGNFGQSYCLYNPVPNSNGTGVFIHTGNYTINNGDSVFGGTGRVKQGALIQVSNGGDPSMGNVYINSDIKYDPGPWTIGKVPSFILRADGNIYISKDVQELDGIYVSLHGHIYTCGNSDYTNKTPDQLWGNCNKQLSVYGSFIANQIDLERTFGTLRNETPIVSGTPSTIGSDKPLALNEFECAPARGPSQYQRSHYYQVDGSTDPANSFGATPGPNNSNCHNPVARSNDGYIFSANDTYFYSYIASKGALGSFDLLCEKQHVISGLISDNQLIPIASSGGIAMCNSSGGTPLGYVFNSSAGNLGGAVIQPLFSNLDSSCYSNFNFYYYSITDNGEPIHNTCDATPTYIGYVFKSNFASIPITGSGYTANPSLVCDNNGNTSGSPSFYKTCAAETFYYDPEMYLTNPALQLPSNGTLEVDSISTLPPVL